MKKFAKLLSATLLTVMLSVILVACIPANAEKATTKMKEEGYSVTALSGLPDGAVEGITAIDASISLSGYNADMIYVYWFESTDSAKSYYDSVEETSSTIKKRKGKCVYIGTADAIEDFED